MVFLVEESCGKDVLSAICPPFLYPTLSPLNISRPKTAGCRTPGSASANKNAEWEPDEVSVPLSSQWISTQFMENKLCLPAKFPLWWRGRAWWQGQVSDFTSIGPELEKQFPTKPTPLGKTVLLTWRGGGGVGAAELTSKALSEGDSWSGWLSQGVGVGQRYTLQ